MSGTGGVDDDDDDDVSGVGVGIGDVVVSGVGIGDVVVSGELLLPRLLLLSVLPPPFPSPLSPFLRFQNCTCLIGTKLLLPRFFHFLL